MLKHVLRRTTALVVLVLSAGAIGADEPATIEFVREWGKKGTEPGEFHSPIGIAIDRNDVLTVTDLNNSRVQRFDTEGNSVGGFELPPDTPPRKSCMLGGVAVDGEGLIYLSYMIQHKITVHDASGKVIREWGKRGTGEGEFQQPGGMVIRDDGTLFVADQCNHRVQQFTLEGKYLGQWGSHGSEPGQFGGPERSGSRFAGPHFLAQDSQGRLYTTEGVMGRVQILTPEGQPVAAWGNKTDEPGGFGSYEFNNNSGTFGPIGVAVDRHDRVWVSSLNDRVQAFTPEGKYLMGLVTSGSNPGELSHPHGMAFDSRGFLYVADAANQRIQKFRIGGE